MAVVRAGVRAPIESLIVDGTVRVRLQWGLVAGAPTAQIWDWQRLTPAQHADLQAWCNAEWNPPATVTLTYED